MKLTSLSNKLIILFSILLIGSCSKDPLPEEIRDLIDIGEYKLLEESISMMPFLNKTSVTFVDSLNNEVELIIDEYDVYSGDSSILYKYNVFEEGDVVRYYYNGEIKKFWIENDSLNVSFHIDLTAQPYYEDPESRFIADRLLIFFKGQGVFYHLVNQRTWISSQVTPEFHEHKEFIDRAFEDLYYWDNQPNQERQLYFNYEFGVVSFRDNEGKLWRFEKFD